ncbi:hypothetical protein AAY473_006781 [Plecturocebus cupreus]
MGPAEAVRYTPLREAPRWDTGKTATPAKRVTLTTHVAPLPGIFRSVGNKNSSETRLEAKEFETKLANMEKLCLYKKKPTKISQAWWQLPVIPVTRQAEVGESPEPGEVKATGSPGAGSCRLHTRGVFRYDPLSSISVNWQLDQEAWPGEVGHACNPSTLGGPGDPQAEQCHGSPVRLFGPARLFRPARLLCLRPGTAVLRTKSTGLCALLTGEWSYGKVD